MRTSSCTLTWRKLWDVQDGVSPKIRVKHFEGHHHEYIKHRKCRKAGRKRVKVVKIRHNASRHKLVFPADHRQRHNAKGDLALIGTVSAVIIFALTIGTMMNPLHVIAFMAFITLNVAYACGLEKLSNESVYRLEAICRCENVLHSHNASRNLKWKSHVGKTNN